MSEKRISYVVLEVTHTRDIAHLAELIAGRAWTIDGVCGVELVKAGSQEELRMAGFTSAEIALGATEVHRS